VAAVASDQGQLTLMMAVATGINAGYQVSKKRDPVPTVIASGSAYFVLSIAGSLTRYDVVNAIAGVYLLGSIIFRAAPIITAVTKLATEVATVTTSSSTSSGAKGQGSSGGGGGGGGGGGV